MTPTPSPPNRRRRRIIVVGIAVIVLGMAWWVWPRGFDSRFVGNWSVNSLPGAGVSRWQFRDDGRTENIERRNVGGKLATYVNTKRWQVHGDVLVLTPSYGTGPFGLYREIKYRLKGMMSGVPVTDTRYRVLEISPKTLRIQRITTPDAQASDPVEEFHK